METNQQSPQAAAFEQNTPMQQTIYVNAVQKSNGIGTAGFIISLLAFVFCWVPVLDFILWFLGALFSFIGIFKKPKGFAIAGLIISFIGIIVIVSVVGAAAAFL